jgi:ubiquinone/menaquinone biosynthesis C-methylase UbiE
VKRLSERILDSPSLYDAVQRVAGIERLRRQLSPVLGALGPGMLLDVGAGTGAFSDLLQTHVRYVPLDLDARKLERLAAMHAGVKGVVGSATALPFDDGSFDYTLCTNVSHHLEDSDFKLMVGELARVTRRQVVFVDALRTSRLTSRVLWSIDRGAHPRAYDELVDVLRMRFWAQSVETFTLRHSYLLFVGAPLAGADGTT